MRIVIKTPAHCREMLSYDITKFSVEKPGDITAGNLQFAGTALDCVIGLSRCFKALSVSTSVFLWNGVKEVFSRQGE